MRTMRIAMVVYWPPTTPPKHTANLVLRGTPKALKESKGRISAPTSGKGTTVDSNHSVLTVDSTRNPKINRGVGMDTEKGKWFGNPVLSSHNHAASLKLVVWSPMVWFLTVVSHLPSRTRGPNPNPGHPSKPPTKHLILGVDHCEQGKPLNVETAKYRNNHRVWPFLTVTPPPFYSTSTTKPPGSKSSSSTRAVYFPPPTHYKKRWREKKIKETYIYIYIYTYHCF